MPLNQVFQALADPARRARLERLGDEPATIGELARPFGMALLSFSRHLAMPIAADWCSRADRAVCAAAAGYAPAQDRENLDAAPACAPGKTPRTARYSTH